MSLCKCEPDLRCKQKNQCYRFRMIGSEWQPYSKLYEPHPNDPSIPCLNFIAIEGRKNIIQIEQVIEKC